MKKYVCTLLLLLLLTGCARPIDPPVGPSTSPVTTTTTPQEPGILAPVFLNATKRWEIEDAWLAQRKEYLPCGWYIEGNVDTVGGMRYYGSFNGYDVVYLPAGAVSEAERFYVYRNGKFWELNSLSAEGLVGRENMDTVLKRHRNCERTITGLLLDAQPLIDAPAQLPRETRWEIENAWQTAGMGELTWYTVERISGTRYYGYFDGYHVLLMPGTDFESTLLAIGKEEFYMWGSFSLYAYREGVFWELSQAYEQGFLSAQGLYNIAQEHRKLEEMLHPDGNGYITKYKKQDIENAWLNKMGRPLGQWYDQNRGEYPDGVRHYGTYQHVDILFVNEASAPAECTIAGVTFVHESGFILYAYCDGQLYSLQAAYDANMMAEETIYYILAQHEWFEQEICKGKDTRN